MASEVTHVWFSSPDIGFTQVISRALGQEFDVHVAQDCELECDSELEGCWDVVLLDLRAACEESSLSATFSLMEKIRQMELPPPIIAILPHEERKMILQLMDRGVFDVLCSPPNVVELRLILRRAYRYREMECELAQLRCQAASTGRFYGIVGQSLQMQQIFTLAKKIAPCDVTLLITGETGTGKELLARAIHQASRRAAHPFVAFSCANLPETLVEDELFGHEKGAYTGAVGFRRGRLEMADRGTLFLDEIGDLGLGLQPKFLRVLQERTFERLGSNTSQTVNIRVICATNRNLAEMMKEGKFREDLFYRLNVVQLELPPLRERRDDIAVLAYTFLERFANDFGKGVRRFSRLALQALEEYAWPGNVRELENVIQRVVVLCDEQTVGLTDLPANIRGGGYDPTALELSYEEEVRRFKRRLVLRTLQECGWRKAKSARTLGVARGYLHRLIHQLQIQEPDAASQVPALAPVSVIDPEENCA